MQFRVGFFMLKGKTVLTKSETAVLDGILTSGDKFAAKLHDAAVKAVSKAYTTAGDGGEFARAVFDVCPVYAKKPLAEWFRKHGLAVSVDGRKGELSRIGGIMQPKHQRKDVEAAKATPVLLLDDVPAKKPRAAKEDVRSVKAKAADAVAAFVARQKKADADVGAAINAMLGKPAWFDKLVDLNLTGEEVDQIVDAVFAARAQGALKAAA